MTSLIPQLLLNAERLYNKHTSFRRGKYACSQLIALGQRYLGFDVPKLRLESGIVLEYSSEVAGDVLLRDLLSTDSFEPEETEIIKMLLPAGGVFLDVGANVGYFSIVAAMSVGSNGRVYAFEPVPEIYRILCRNIFLNGLTNVSPHNLACFSSVGEMAMERETDSGKSHLSAVDVENAQKVRLTTIDQFVNLSNVSRLDLIKIDAEGSDFEIVQGARRTIETFRPAILMELDHLSRFGGSRSEVETFFTDCCYEVKEIKGKHSVDFLCKPATGSPS